MLMVRFSESAEPRAAAQMDRELVIAARAGQVWAAEALYRRHRKMVDRVASRFAQGHDRDDLVQDAFLKALCSLDRIDHPELFGSWLRAVVARTAAHGFQRKRPLARLTSGDAILPEHLASRVAPPDVLAELGNIYRLLERLPVEARMVFLLRRVERMSIGEVAARLGRSVATVKRRLVHAERVLDRRMAGSRTPPARARGKAARRPK